MGGVVFALSRRVGRAGGGPQAAALHLGQVSVVQPLLVIIDPVVSIALSVWLFGEYFVTNAGMLAAAAAGFCVMCAGVVVMSLTAPATLQADVGPAGKARVIPKQASKGGWMLPISFNSVLIIAGISVFVPAVLGLLPGLPVPGAVLEVIAGIVVGPSVLGWARIDAPVEVLSTLGLGMLLFLAGLEIDVERLRSPLSRLAGLAFGVSAALGIGGGFLFWLAGGATQPILLGIVLMSTSAGLLLPLLKDAGEAGTEFGQLIMTAAALAEIVPILLLSLLFSASAKTPGDQLVSLAIFVALLVLIGLAVAGVRRLRRLDQLLDYLSRRSGQLRVRAALTLALGCGVLAYQFGFASILGAFAAGLLVRIIEISGREPNRDFLIKLEGIGFGFLDPGLLHQHGRGLPAEGPARAPGRARAGAAAPPRLAGRAGSARGAVRARRGPPPRGGGRPAAGHHADVRHRGDGDRA